MKRPRFLQFESFAPFRHRDFALFWSGAFVSNIGTWMETVAFGIYVTNRTGQAVWPGIVAAATFVPTAFLGPVGGALADRMPRKAILLTTTGADVLRRPHHRLDGDRQSAPIVVVLVAFGSGCAAAIGFPAYQALIPDLVPVEDLPGAIALGSAQWNLGRVIGPLLAGIAISLGGVPWALGANTVSFFAVIFVLLLITLPRPSADARLEKIGAAIRSGIRFVRADPGLRIVIQTMSLSMLLAAPFIALVPAMAIKVLHSGKSGTSVLVTAQGIGGERGARDRTARKALRDALDHGAIGDAGARSPSSSTPSLPTCRCRPSRSSSSARCTSRRSRASRRSRSSARRRSTAVASSRSTAWCSARCTRSAPRSRASSPITSDCARSPPAPRS